ncbi:MAG: hypothetical protein IOD12_09275 [Silvanigrellales bacterium]|nr:hypothetical protein [Silvanigrellales bacterium]
MPPSLVSGRRETPATSLLFSRPFRLSALLSMLVCTAWPTATAFGASVSSANPGKGSQVFLGGSVLVEGDGRAKPAVVLGGVVGDGYFANLFLSGQRFTIVSRTSQLLSVGKRWPVAFPFSGRFSFAGGLSVLREETRIGATATSAALSETLYNGALALAVQFRVLQMARASLDLDWSNHIFPAGLATVYLATGRKQFVSLTAGVALP